MPKKKKKKSWEPSLTDDEKGALIDEMDKVIEDEKKNKSFLSSDFDVDEGEVLKTVATDTTDTVIIANEKEVVLKKKTSPTQEILIAERGRSRKYFE